MLDEVEPVANSTTKAGASTDSPLLLTAAQVAMLLQVSTRTLWRMVCSSEVIPPVYIRGNTRWQRLHLEQWVAAGCPPIIDKTELDYGSNLLVRKVKFEHGSQPDEGLS